MKKQIHQKFPAVISIVLFFISFFFVSCSKSIKRPDIGKPGTANSKIVYTVINPDSVIISSSNQLYNLDLNNDGTTDFIFNSKTLSSNCGAYSDIGYPSSNSYEKFLEVSVKPASDINAIITSGSNKPPALDSSVAIIPYSVWANTTQFLLTGTIKRAGRCNTIFPAAGNWLNVSYKYLGLKLIKDNNTYYGWARLTSTYSTTTSSSSLLIEGQLTLSAYAYNSTPNQPIFAGQTE